MSAGTDNAQGDEMNPSNETQHDRAEDVMDACSASAQGHAEGWGVPTEAHKSPRWFAAYMLGAAVVRAAQIQKDGAVEAAQIQKAGAVEAARIEAAATDRQTAAIQKRKGCDKAR